MDPALAGIGAFWIAGAAMVAVSYVIAGYIWQERHSLRLRVAKRAMRVSGGWGEVVFFSACALLLVTIEAMTPAGTIAGFLTGQWVVWAILFTLVGASVYAYCVLTAVRANTQGQPPDFRRRLVLTYLTYALYSTILYAGGVLLIWCVMHQFIADSAFFQARSAEILAGLPEAGTRSAGTTMMALEEAHIDALILLNQTQDQMSPVFILAAGIFMINFVILYTPLRSLYLNNAVLITNMTTFIAVMIILVSAGAVYVLFYSVFVNELLAAVMAQRPALSGSDAALLERYGEIVASVVDRRSLFGFLTGMLNEWGGLTAVLGAIQWVGSQFAKESAEASPAELAARAAHA